MMRISEASYIHDREPERSLGVSISRLPQHGDKKREEWQPEDKPEEWQSEEEPEGWQQEEPEERVEEEAVPWQPEVEPEEWTAEKADEEPKTWAFDEDSQPETLMVEGINEETEEWSSVVPGDKPDAEPREWPIREATRKPKVKPPESLVDKSAEEALNSDFRTLSGYKNNANLGPLKEFSSKPPSNSDIDKTGSCPRTVSNNSNEKKRSLDALPDDSLVFINYQIQKKHRQEESPNPTTEDVGPGVAKAISFGISGLVDDNTSELEHPGSSGKRKCALNVDDSMQKRRKTRWDVVSSELKVLGPLQLPDFEKWLAPDHELELEILGLKGKLLVINSELQKPELHDDRPEEERSPSPEPVYNHLGIRTNTREFRLRKKLIEERQSIISKLIQNNPGFKALSENKPPMLFKKLYIPVKEYPGYNFVGLIIGPRGNTQKRMQRETGAMIQVKGKGASKKLPEFDNSNTEDLHVYIEADNQTSLDAAVAMVEKLLIPFDDKVNEHKIAQMNELALLNGENGGIMSSKVCSEEGNEHYSCSCQPSAFPTPISNKICLPSLPAKTPSTSSNSLPGSSGHGRHSSPTTQRNPEKEFNNSNLYVANLPQALDDNFLKELFSPFGEIASARVIKDYATGFSKGYGFVNFKNSDEAEMAVLHLNGYKMFGRILTVRVAGHMPVTRTSIPVLPNYYPLTAAVHPEVQSPTTCLYSPRAYTPNTAGEDFSSLSMYYYSWGGQLNPTGEAVGYSVPEISNPTPTGEAVGYPVPVISNSTNSWDGQLNPTGEAVGYPVPAILNPINSSYESSVASYYASPSQIHFVSAASVAQAPYYSDCSPLYQPYFATTVSEPPSELLPTQLSNSESERATFSATELQQKCVTSPTGELQQVPLEHLQHSSEVGPKTTVSATTDLPQRELLMQFHQSTE